MNENWKNIFQKVSSSALKEYHKNQNIGRKEGSYTEVLNLQAIMLICHSYHDNLLSCYSPDVKF